MLRRQKKSKKEQDKGNDEESLEQVLSISDVDSSLYALDDGGAAVYHELQRITEEARESGVEREVDMTSLDKLTAAPSTSQGTAVASSHSTRIRQKRLMREYKDIMSCDSVQTGVFSVELQGESLVEWDIKLHKFDNDSLIYRDLQAFKQQTGIDNVWIRVSFPSAYPFAPPFARVIAPFVQGGFVLSGGAICLELLTPDGWVQSYKMESVILQIMNTISKGKSRIVGRITKPLSLDAAVGSYDYLVRVHKKHGWRDSPKGDG